MDVCLLNLSEARGPGPLRLTHLRWSVYITQTPWCCFCPASKDGNGGRGFLITAVTFQLMFTW